MATYVAQRKRIFIGEVIDIWIGQCGVSILTNQNVLVVTVSHQVFNYFGMHNLFDTGTVAQLSFYLILSIELVLYSFRRKHRPRILYSESYAMFQRVVDALES
jgi:hypothetical protein